MATILVVDDDAHIREIVSYALAREGHQVEVAGDGAAALARIGRGGIDLVVLDVVMPELDGLSVCRELRAARGTLPIILLSSRGEELDRILGLDLGADDYVPKPFSPRELATRVRAVLRRAAPPAAATATPPGAPSPAPAPLVHGRLVVDPASHEVSVDGQRIEFTVSELAILRALLEVRGRVLTRGQLIERLRDGDYHITERTIDTHVRRIRAKLRPHGLDAIDTVHGLGYKAAPPS